MCHDAYSSGVVDEVTLGVETDDVGVLPVNEMSGWESESEPMSVRGGDFFSEDYCELLSDVFLLPRVVSRGCVVIGSGHEVQSQ